MRRHHSESRSKLPAGYRQLEYIQTSYINQQFIDTGITGVNGSWRFEFDVMPTGTYHCGLHGTRNNNAGNRIASIIVMTTTIDGRVDYECEGLSYTTSDAYAPANQRHYIVVTKNIIVVDGVSYAKQYRTCQINNNNLILMAFECNSRTKTCSNGRWYRIKVFDSDGSPRLDLTPALRLSDNQPGMYDNINSQFFTNAGSGEFLYA